MKVVFIGIIGVVAIGASLWWFMINLTKAPVVKPENPVVKHLLDI